MMQDADFDKDGKISYQGRYFHLKLTSLFNIKSSNKTLSKFEELLMRKLLLQKLSVYNAFVTTS